MNRDREKKALQKRLRELENEKLLVKAQLRDPVVTPELLVDALDLFPKSGYRERKKGQ
jgi:hypothetical protein